MHWLMFGAQATSYRKVASIVIREGCQKSGHVRYLTKPPSVKSVSLNKIYLHFENKINNGWKNLMLGSNPKICSIVLFPRILAPWQALRGSGFSIPGRVGKGSGFKRSWVIARRAVKISHFAQFHACTHTHTRHEKIPYLYTFFLAASPLISYGLLVFCQFMRKAVPIEWLSCWYIIRLTGAAQKV